MTTSQDLPQQMPERPRLEIDPDRGFVRMRLVGVLDAGAATELRKDAVGLLGCGFSTVVVDLRDTTAIGAAGLEAIAELDRYAREGRARLLIALGDDELSTQLRHAGLLGRLQLEGAATEPFFDWTR